MLTTKLPSEFRDPVVLQPPAVPTASEDSKYTGIYTLLVSLISLSGGSLPDAKMERCLARLQMEDRTPIPEYDRTEKLIKRMEKDGYIVKVKESSGAGDDDIYWVVGPRGKVEVGEDGVRGLTKTVFGTMETEADEEELERKIARSLGLGEKPDSRKAAAAPPAESTRRGRNAPNGGNRRARNNNGDDDGEADDDEEMDEDE
jgi:DNA-binding PadR family transcriptional regulator